MSDQLGTTLPLNVLLQVHVTLLVASFLFVGVAQSLQGESRASERREFRKYVMSYAASRIFRGTVLVALLCAVSSALTLLLAAIGASDVASAISAALVAIELLAFAVLAVVTLRALDPK